MLLKILLTLAVIVAAYMKFHKRKPVMPSVSANSLLVRYLALGILFTTVLLSSVWLGWRWYDGNRVLSVTIISPERGEERIFKVRKRNLGQSELETLDGLKIRLSSQERIMISSSDQN
ncbi:hypothetical protein [Shewanella sp. FJAT-52076]|uniref:hypothetical protein n=1 Tax=Shewanella sp. FJAT-52076 TaxID=2864202 RepID=UPI001C65F4B7|nr:hypothetical protein [Shewanella sp. FJAT-52076]QYJ76863.1 hypothetical protein K0H79_07870 [Shewanella sp. FJAT-52076]